MGGNLHPPHGSREKNMPWGIGLITTNMEVRRTSVKPFQIYSKKQDYYEKNSQVFSDDMSEVDLTKMVLYPPNCSELPSCTIKK